MPNYERFSDKDLPYDLQMRGFQTARPFFATDIPSREALDAHLTRVTREESDQSQHLLEIRIFTPQERTENFITHNAIADQSLQDLKERGLFSEPAPRANAE